MSFLIWLYKSSKTEAKVLLVVFASLFILPLFAVVAIANAGIAGVAHALVSVNPITHLVEIHNANGKLVKTLNVSTIWPANGVVTLEFGAPDPPYQLHHTGIDIANRHQRQGDPISVFMPGKVIFAGWQTGYGNVVYVDHGNNITSIYGHMETIYAHKGEEVKPGDVIGLMGMTGWATGPHVHFEIRVYDIPVNPRTFMIGNPNPGP